MNSAETNKHFQLSVPKSCSFGILIKDVACGEDHACIITKKGHIYAMGNNAYGKLGCGTKHNLDSNENDN
jgi:alpha-tubulin suppressor-like RCC1 family protein